MPCYLNNDNVQSTIEVFLYDAAGSPVTGFVPGAAELKVGKNNAGALANWLGVWTERGNGSYTYKPTNAEANTLGEIILQITAAAVNGGKTMHFVDEVRLPEWRGAVAGGTLTTTAFTTDLTSFANANQLVDAWVEFLTGNNKGSIKPIGAYTVAGGLIALKTGHALAVAPVATDKFRIITR